MALRYARWLLAAALAGSAHAAPLVHFNQVGFEIASPKKVVISDPSSTPLEWTIVDSRGSVAASGRTSVVGDDSISGDHVHIAELGSSLVPGTYRLKVGETQSSAVIVAVRPFAPLASAALNYFYQTRAGIPIEARYAGGEAWARAAGHPHEVAFCFKGADEAKNMWPGCGTYERDVTGGWYDAGDQGKYVVNGGIALWTLQNLYEVASLAGKAPFPDGSAQLPEAGNKVNDLLDEARWEMKFLLSMQVPDGRRMAVAIGPQPKGRPLKLIQIDAGGMAHHKVTDLHWTSLPTIPSEDKEARVLFPPSTAATLNLAATSAQCARIWRTRDSAFAAQCLKAATRAFAAATRNPAIFAPDAFTGGGSYGDTDVSDEFYWAAAELYATTRLPRYKAILEKNAAFDAPLKEPSWGSTSALGTITLAITPGLLNASEQQVQQKLVVNTAQEYVSESRHSAYGIPFHGDKFVWGSNGAIMNRAMILGVAAHLTGNIQFRAGMIDALDYVLGRNPLDISYVSGFGSKSLQNPHHRFWAHELDARLPGPPPGVLSGGPNNTSFSDPVAAKLEGECAPMRCWRDDIHAYALNEVAINWNAPLLWVATYLDQFGSATAPSRQQ